MDVNSFFSIFSIDKLGINWIDFVLLIVFFFYGLEGRSSGFLNAFFDLLGFLLSFIGGLSLYSLFGKFLISIFLIPRGFANAIGFFIAAFLVEIIVSVFFKKFVSVFKLSKHFGHIPKIIDTVLGIFTSLLSAFILASFILTMIIGLPVSNFFKSSVLTSRIGSFIVANTQGFSKGLNNVFGGALNETLTFLTVEPKSNESVNLNFKTSNISIDPVSEKKMLVLVNKERTARGIRLLDASPVLTDVGRRHCEDMFKRGYFSHFTPEGLSPFDRMGEENISFTFAGENLALAPNVDLAMQGLMQSPGHRENILSPDFGKLGIGVIDGGIYGEMFCQEFTD